MRRSSTKAIRIKFFLFFSNYDDEIAHTSWIIVELTIYLCRHCFFADCYLLKENNAGLLLFMLRGEILSRCFLFVRHSIVLVFSDDVSSRSLKRQQRSLIKINCNNTTPIVGK